MRLFLGIFPDQATHAYMRDVYRRFDKEKRNLKNVPNDQLHLTVRFIGGRVSDKSKNLIIDQLRAMKGTLAKPKIEIVGLKFGFARQHDPRVLFAEVKATPELVALQDQINFILKKLDLHDTIKWKPHKDRHFHFSIARLKPAATRSTGRDVKEILSKVDLPKPEPFWADELIAVQSIVTSRSKPVYKKLETVEL